MYLLYIFPPFAPHTYDFVVLTSLTYQRKIILAVLQRGNRKSQRLIGTPTYIYTPYLPYLSGLDQIDCAFC
jgi:hypothetical protein